MRKLVKIASAVFCLAMWGGSAIAQETDAEKVLNVYNWADYIGPHTVRDFSEKYGIQVRYDNFSSGNELEAKVMAGGTGYDVIVPSTMFYPRGLKAGVFLPLDKQLLPNWKNLDQAILAQVSEQGIDPGNKYAMPYISGITGFVYNKDMIEKRMPDAPVNSLRMLFDPAVVSKFADCGVDFPDSPEDVVQLALVYDGKSPNSNNPDDIAAAYATLTKIRPYVRSIGAASVDTLSSGDQCLAINWSGIDMRANAKAAEAGKPASLVFVVPQEGAPMYLDNLLIPADAPHSKNAHLFLNYIMDGKVTASIINEMSFTMPNKAALEDVKPEIKSNTALFPSDELMKRVTIQAPRTSAGNSSVAKGWVLFKAGQ